MTTKSRAASAAEKAARMGAAPVTPAAAAAPAPVPELKSKPVRVSLDLTPALYEDLTGWGREAARRLGRPRVTNADVLRTLVRALLDRPELADEVIRRLDTDQ